ncbi:PEP-CTERM sorting domain-containing protein [Gemmata sp.]|uniref:PEP-CTERM sorting domain-containing protein n=1 Tax=Gemmata sp. TaxID=1914242 RepID=UPI003F712973
MFQRTWIMGLLGAGLVALAANAPAQAGLLPVNVSVQKEGNSFRWTYAVQLPTDYKLQSGDYFTVYDFEGYVNGTGSVLSPYPDDSAKANWEFSTSKTGPTPGLLNPKDDASIDNLTWKYIGPTIPSGQLSLGNFIAVSEFEESKKTHFTGTNPSAVNGEIDSNITDTDAPTGTSVPPGVPEPTTLALLGIGLPLVGGARVFRRRRAA